MASRQTSEAFESRYRIKKDLANELMFVKTLHVPKYKSRKPRLSDDFDLDRCIGLINGFGGQDQMKRATVAQTLYRHMMTGQKIQTYRGTQMPYTGYWLPDKRHNTWDTSVSLTPTFSFFHYLFRLETNSPYVYECFEKHKDYDPNYINWFAENAKTVGVGTTIKGEYVLIFEKKTSLGFSDLWELSKHFTRRFDNESAWFVGSRGKAVREKGYTALNHWKDKTPRKNKQGKNHKCPMCKRSVTIGRLATGVWVQVVCDICEGRFFKSMRRHLQRTWKIEAFEKKKRERELAWLKVGRKRIQEMKKLLRNPETVKNPEAVTSVKMESKREKILHV